MRKIFVINDNSDEAAHAVEFTLMVAQKAACMLILANNFIKSNRAVINVPAAQTHGDCIDEHVVSGTESKLSTLNKLQVGFRPEVIETDISAFDENLLTAEINTNDTWMVVKGVADGLPEATSNINFNRLINKIKCPLLLISVNWHIKDIERLLYITDLRYCVFKL